VVARQLAQRVPAAAGAKFGVHGSRQCPVEAAREASGEEWIQVVALFPVALVAQAGLDPFVELGPGQRVADRDADVVGRQLAQQVARLPDLGPSLGGVAELQDTCSTVIPLSIASSTVWAPDSTPSQASRQPARRSAATFSSVIKSARV
jgi:hypothetical protein